MSLTSKVQTRRGFTLIELLIVIAIICILAALVMSGVNRSREKARRVKCQDQLREFYAVAVMYAEDHDGYLCSYEDMLKQIPMLCPSDQHHGRKPHSGFVYNLPTSFRASVHYFLNGTNRGERLSAWSKVSVTGSPGIMLSEYEPYHDLSKQVGFEPDKWKGGFLLLNADGSTPWLLLEQ